MDRGKKSFIPFQTVARPWKLFVRVVGGARVIATLVSIWPPVLGINVKFIIVFNTHTHEQQGKIRDHQVQNEGGVSKFNLLRANNIYTKKTSSIHETIT